MKARKAEQTEKQIGGCSGTATATAAPLSLSPSPAATAPAQPNTGAGFTVFPNGVSIPTDLQVPPEPDGGEWQRGSIVSVNEFLKALEQQERKLLMLRWRERQTQPKTKWWILKQQKRQSRSRRKAKNESRENDASSHSDFWFAATMPHALRAPTFALPAGVATSG